jgi:DNA-directed RNA polymerase beta subunit/DNA-directed RNA polymerase beta' subunit
MDFEQKILPDVISNMWCETDDVIIKHRMDTLNSQSAREDKDGNLLYTVVDLVTIVDKHTKEEIVVPVDLVDIFARKYTGYQIRGVNRQVLGLFERTRGWHFSSVAKGGKVRRSASFFCPMGYRYSFQTKKVGQFSAVDKNTKDSLHVCVYRNTASGGSSVGLDLPIFLKALTGNSFSSLFQMIGFINPYVAKTFNIEEPSFKDCVNSSAGYFGMLRGGTSLPRLDMFGKRIFGDSSSIGNGRIRLTNMFMFKSNLVGTYLAKEIVIGDKHFAKGLALTPELLSELDYSEVDRIEVTRSVNDPKLYVFIKFDNYNFRGLNKGLDVTLDSLISASQGDEETFIVRDYNGNDVELHRTVPPSHNNFNLLMGIVNLFFNYVNDFSLQDNLNSLENQSSISLEDKIIEDVCSKISDINDTVVYNEISEEPKLYLLVRQLASLVLKRNSIVEAVCKITSKENQVSSLNNAVAFVAKEYKIIKPVTNLTVDATNVDFTQWGRLDTNDVPEGPQIGKVYHKTFLSGTSEGNSITAPYIAVKDGEVVSNTPIYLTVDGEKDQYIADWNETFKDADGNKKTKVRAKYNDTIMLVDVSKVKYKLYSCFQLMSVSSMLQVFPENMALKRVQMASNHVKQAIPVLFPERPFVGSGGESLVGDVFVTAKDILDSYCRDGEETPSGIHYDQWIESKLHLFRWEDSGTDRTYYFHVESGGRFVGDVTKTLPYLVVLPTKSLFGYRLNPHLGTVFTGNDIILHHIGFDAKKYRLNKKLDYGSYTPDESKFESAIAQGKNLLVGYKTFSSSTIDDAVTINQSLVGNNTLTTISLYNEEYEIRANNPNYSESFGFIDTSNIPSGFTPYGVPKVGIILAPGSTVIYKHRKKHQPDGKIISVAIERNIVLPNTVGGQVVASSVSLDAKVANVTIASFAPIEVGDKLAGRFGNKSVVAKIVPEHLMDYDVETGDILDIVLNPLGIPSRTNIGQLLEAVLSMCGRVRDEVFLVSPYQTRGIDFVRDMAKKCNVTPRHLASGSTGVVYERPVLVGRLYVNKLEHRAALKIHAIGLPDELTPDFLQPSGSGAHGEKGQAFSEMEVWCLLSVGALKVLQDLFSIQSDDVLNRDKLLSIINSEPSNISLDGENRNNLSTCVFTRSLCVDIDEKDGNFVVKPLKNSYILGLNTNYVNPQTAEEQLRSPLIFGRSMSHVMAANSRNVWSYIPLGTEIVHPFWLVKGKIYKYFIGIFVKSFRSKNNPNIIETVSKIEPIKEHHLLDIARSEIYVSISEDGHLYLYTCDISKPVARRVGKDEVSRPSYTVTGIEAIVDIMRKYDLKITESYYEGIIGNSSESDLVEQEQEQEQGEDDNVLESEFEFCGDKTYTDAIFGYQQILSGIRRMRDDGDTLEDYIINALPVMPITYRPEILVGNYKHDFDQYYKFICNSIVAYSRSPSEQGRYDIYCEIAKFVGIADDSMYAHSKTKSETAVDLKTYFCDKDKGGRFRTSILKKRLLCSGRAVIVPSSDPGREPTKIGVPYLMAIDLWRPQLCSILNKRVSMVYSDDVKYDILRFSVMQNYTALEKVAGLKLGDGKRFAGLVKEFITSYCESRVVIVGRQPSFHVYNVRALWPILVEGKSIEIHPLLCGGYNADFDGDQMWITALLTDEAGEEALEKLAPDKGLVNPQNSSIIVSPVQDMLLGLYYITMLKDNALGTECYTNEEKQLRFYPSLDILREELELGRVRPWNFACVRANNGKSYVSTAGRLLLNSILPDGWTNSLYKDPYGLLQKLPTNLYRVKYDGILSGRGGGRVGYCSVDSICTYLQEHYDSDVTLRYINKLSEFGFLWAHRSGISFLLDDLKEYKHIDEYLRKAESLVKNIDADYANGLCSNEGRKEALLKVYSFYKSEKFEKGFLNNLGRNNNLFIIYDSKARGSIDQLVQTCGVLGILQKTQTEDLDVPVVSNFTSGISVFDAMMASFSSRIGLTSLQNETPKSGELTRNAIYVTSGLSIVEHDCGSEGYDVPLEYVGYFTHMLAKIVRNGKVVKNDIAITPSDLYGRKILDSYLLKIAGYLVNSDGEMNADVFSMAVKRKIPVIRLCGDEINDVLEVRTGFVLAEFYKSYLLLREYVGGGEIPGLLHGKYLTQKSIQYLEDVGAESVKIRTIVNCHSENGICQRCHGLKYENKLLPEIGEYVGFTSSQSIGERAAQLTISLFHKGGAAGEDISSDVSVMGEAMKSRSLKIRPSTVALVAPESGIVKVLRNSGSSPLVSVGGKVIGIATNPVIVSNGEWVDVGTKLTSGIIHPINSFVNFGEESLYYRRLELTKWFYSIFQRNQIKVNARHFELFSRAKLSCVRVLKSDNPNILPGTMCDASTVLNAVSNGYHIWFDHYLMRHQDVLINSSGPFTAICMSDAMGKISAMSLSRKPLVERGLGRIALGGDINKGIINSLPKFKPFDRIKSTRAVVSNSVNELSVLFDTALENFNLMTSFSEGLSEPNFDDIFSNMDSDQINMGEEISKPKNEPDSDYTPLDEEALGHMNVF